jgi:mRNA interferase MazF
MLSRQHEQTIIENLLTLSPERVAEVEDFVDFLRSRAEESWLVAAAAKLSEGTLHTIWDNPDDADYDRCEFGDIILVAFPFTDQLTTKRRPAVVISSAAYHRERPDYIIMAVTSRRIPSPSESDVVVRGWESAGLLRPSVIKPVIATIERRLVLRRLGKLSRENQAALRRTIRVILGRDRGGWSERLKADRVLLCQSRQAASAARWIWRPAPSTSLSRWSIRPATASRASSRAARSHRPPAASLIWSSPISGCSRSPKKGMALREIAPGLAVEEIKATTGCHLIIPREVPPVRMRQ